ncbi:hypothetical protein GDO86_007931 [Hymenochirus boettgeri]|uniref:Uncharacterized protein n=1 Tax=Hymenochirus boettgeri TaxID=247094 RepID=A0A8T2J2Y0_9PIPI|nr:hypothetical protein GDO86_007931 [Hymenochirus boettgeri]
MRDSIVQDPCQGRHSTAYILQEVTENKRLLWKEYESLRRDVDFLHEKLRRQEDDMLRQLSMCQEVKRSQDRNAKMLEGILSNQQSHSLERTRTMSDTLGLQRDLLQIRAEIVDLKENIRILERNLNVAVSIPKDEDEQVKPLAQRKKTTELASSSDTASQLSLSDISSEDTSYSLNDTAPSKGLRATTEHSSQGKKTRTILDDFSDDLDEVCGSPPELNFSDL